jgi:hypothetical protein
MEMKHLLFPSRATVQPSNVYSIQGLKGASFTLALPCMHVADSVRNSHNVWMPFSVAWRLLVDDLHVHTFLDYNTRLQNAAQCQSK